MNVKLTALVFGALFGALILSGPVQAAGNVKPGSSIHTYASRPEVRDWAMRLGRNEKTRNELHMHITKSLSAAGESGRIEQFEAARKELELAEASTSEARKKAARSKYYGEVNRVIGSEEIISVRGTEANPELAFNPANDIARFMEANRSGSEFDLNSTLARETAAADMKLQTALQAYPDVLREAHTAARMISRSQKNAGTHAQVLEAIAGLFGDISAVKPDGTGKLSRGKGGGIVECVACSGLTPGLAEVARTALASGAEPARIADFISGLRDMMRDGDVAGRDASARGIVGLHNRKVQAELEAINGLIANKSLADAMLQPLKDVNNGSVKDSALASEEVSALKRALEGMDTKGKSYFEVIEMLRERLEKEGLEEAVIARIMERVRAPGSEAMIARIEELTQKRNGQEPKVTKEQKFKFFCGDLKTKQKPCTIVSPSSIFQAFGSVQGAACLASIAAFVGVTATAGHYAYTAATEDGDQTAMATDAAAAARPAAGGAATGAPKKAKDHSRPDTN